MIQGIEKEYENGESLYKLVDTISKVKNFLLFNAIYAEILDKNKNLRFDKAFKKLNKIEEVYLKNQTKTDIVKLNEDYNITVKRIKEELKNNDKEADDFIE